MDKVTRIPVLSLEILMRYGKAQALIVQMFLPTKRSYHKDTHVKSQSSKTQCSKDISNVKVYKKWFKLQGQGHGVKINGTHGKVLSPGILM